MITCPHNPDVMHAEGDCDLCGVAPPYLDAIPVGPALEALLVQRHRDEIALAHAHVERATERLQRAYRRSLESHTSLDVYQGKLDTVAGGTVTDGIRDAQAIADDNGWIFTIEMNGRTRRFIPGGSAEEHIKAQFATMEAHDGQ